MVAVVSILVSLIGAPRKHNDTTEQIRNREELEHIEQEHREAQERLQREAEQKVQEERERTERQQREERERHENEIRQAREENERREAADKIEREEIQRQALERVEQAQLRHEQEKRRLEEESRARLAAQAAEAERILREQEEGIRKQRAEMNRKQAELQSKYMAGIQPEVWPTSEERKRAEEQLLEPKEEYFHCAIAGLAGSGKSSLINAFRGLRNSSPSSAPTGVIETTMRITAYRDPSTERPRSRFVWYDVPGAGTNKIKGWQYFNSQGLFVFDLIIVVVDNRFSEQDLIILQHCERYKIPSFIVRSKADQHILNTMNQDYVWEGSDDERDFNEVYLKAREKVVSQTRANYRANLGEGGLDPNKPVYIVSCDALLGVVQGEKRKLRKANQLIDEPQLLLKCLEAVKARRF